MSYRRPILLAEDNANDAELILAAFRQARLDNEVIITRDGEAALAYLDSCRGSSGHRTRVPAVIVLDLKMPRLGGHDVLRRIRADATLSATPIVILTSSREEADLRQSYDLGANACVVKPVDSEEFIVAIGRLGTFWAALNEAPPAKPQRAM
jgi:CheY-like chemotaxis protein